MNTIEYIEKKAVVSFLKEFKLALPNEDNFSLEIKKKWSINFLSVKIIIYKKVRGSNRYSYTAGR